jgi:hypothetical protein
MSPTQRTLAEIRKQGHRAGIVEKFNRFVGPHGIRQDLFGCIDILALDHSRGVIGIQSTGQAFREHELAMLGEKAKDCVDWLKTPGAHLELWGWRKLKVKRGGKAMKWEIRKRVFKLEDFSVAGSSVRASLAEPPVSRIDPRAPSRHPEASVLELPLD